MGRKKRKADSGIEDEEQLTANDNNSNEGSIERKPLNLVKSGYAVTSHSGEIIQEDIYISDGSTTSDEADIQVVLLGSRAGIMRRGLHQLSTLQQPNRQWTRQSAVDGKVNSSQNLEKAPLELTEEEKRRAEEEELAKLDPTQRAARLLQEKQRKLEEIKELARQAENEENAAKDPTLFSKRTAFDIRFDQIDDKPWTRGTGDLSDYFNYGLTEGDWLEYAQQQLIVRQELIDAARQKRSPDPNIVPVQKHIVVGNDLQEISETKVDEEMDETIVDEEATEATVDEENQDDESEAEYYDESEGGAWGAHAPPGSVLAKLIEVQSQTDEKNGLGGAKISYVESNAAHEDGCAIDNVESVRESRGRGVRSAWDTSRNHRNEYPKSNWKRPQEEEGRRSWRR